MFFQTPNPALPVATLQAGQGGTDRSFVLGQVLMAAVASDFSTQADLARSRFVVARRALAANPNLDPALHAVLLADSDLEVRVALLSNSSVPLTLDLPLEPLRGSERGRAYLDAELRECDQATRAALEPNWSASVAEFRAAVMTLGTS